jgi:catechol 2,3-dioxygenase-like lactoylglutathione lyase family enzyme
VIDITKDLPPLGHVGYVVDDVGANAEKYRRSLGIENFRIYDFTPDNVWADGRKIPGGCTLRIAIGTIKNEMKIELIQPVAGDTPHARFLREKGPGIHHVAFYSKDYDEWRAYFKDKGAQFVFEAETEDEVIGYRRSFYAQVPDMVGLIEITEIARKRK